MKKIIFFLGVLISAAGLCAQVPGSPYILRAKKDKAVVTSIDCAGATHNGSLYDGEPAVGVSSIIAYTDGNGETYSAQNIGSTGVTDLTASLTAGTLNVGAGTLTYNITGTPSGMGIASFAITFGGESCDLDRGVGGLGEIPGNATCVAAIISVTPCSAVSGATLNDDAGTADGLEYDWPGGSDYIDGATERNLVEINGQCWYRRNAKNIPSNFDPVPTWNAGVDVGWSGYYGGSYKTDEGRLYQWSALMNASAGERAQGVCAPGWHVPSDCEFMYLESTLDMSLSDQTSQNFRYSGEVGSKLSPNAASGTNSTGMTLKMGGVRDTSGNYTQRNSQGYYASSTGRGCCNEFWVRWVRTGQVGVARNYRNEGLGLSVRCLKD